MSAVRQNMIGVKAATPKAAKLTRVVITLKNRLPPLFILRAPHVNQSIVIGGFFALPSVVGFSGHPASVLTLFHKRLCVRNTALAQNLLTRMFRKSVALFLRPFANGFKPPSYTLRRHLNAVVVYLAGAFTASAIPNLNGISTARRFLPALLTTCLVVFIWVARMGATVFTPTMSDRFTRSPIIEIVKCLTNLTDRANFFGYDSGSQDRNLQRQVSFWLGSADRSSGLLSRLYFNTNVRRAAHNNSAFHRCAIRVSYAGRVVL